jgi:hypothetical protein
VGDVKSDTHQPKAAPIKEQRFDETEVAVAKAVTFTEITPRKGAALAAQIDLIPSHLGIDAGIGAIVEHDVYASIYNPGKLALLASWKDSKVADSWSPMKLESIDGLRHRKIRVVRDYGRYDRREAPQFYRDVEGAETKHPEPAH